MVIYIIALLEVFDERLHTENLAQCLTPGLLSLNITQAAKQCLQWDILSLPLAMPMAVVMLLTVTGE